MVTVDSVTRLLRIGERLPPLHLTRAPDGGTEALRAPPRGAPVLLFLPPDAARFREYRRALSEAADEMRKWDGRLLLVAPQDPEAAADRSAGDDPPHVSILTDPAGEARERCGVGERTGALFIADRWGQIYFAAEAEREDELPAIDEIREWLIFLATQCPECGVIDEPGYGEWART